MRDVRHGVTPTDNDVPKRRRRVPSAQHEVVHRRRRCETSNTKADVERQTRTSMSNVKHERRCQTSNTNVVFN
jgi:hypothetical protein